MCIPLEEKGLTKKAPEQQLKKLFRLLYDFSWDMTIRAKTVSAATIEKSQFHYPCGSNNLYKDLNVHLCKNN